MKKYWLLFMAAAGSVLPASAQSSNHNLFASVAGTYTFPGEDDWNSAVGVEGRAGVTLVDGLRLYGLLGYSNWDLDSTSDTEFDVTLTADGYADVFSVGGGIDYLFTISKKCSVSLGANIQYQIVNSHVDFSSNDPFGDERVTIELDNAAGVFVGADFLYALGDQVDLLFGVGYLFNISKSDVSNDDSITGDTKFDGVTLRAGVNF